MGGNQPESLGLMRQQLWFISMAPSNQSIMTTTRAPQTMQQGPFSVESNLNTSVFSWHLKTQGVDFIIQLPVCGESPDLCICSITEGLEAYI